MCRIRVSCMLLAFSLLAVPSMLVCSGYRRRRPPPPPPPELALHLLGPHDCWTPNSSPSSYFRKARTLHSSTSSEPKPSEALNPKRSALNQTAQPEPPRLPRTSPKRASTGHTSPRERKADVSWCRSLRRHLRCRGGVVYRSSTSMIQ